VPLNRETVPKDPITRSRPRYVNATLPHVCTFPRCSNAFKSRRMKPKVVRGKCLITSPVVCEAHVFYCTTTATNAPRVRVALGTTSPTTSMHHSHPLSLTGSSRPRLLFGMSIHTALRDARTRLAQQHLSCPCVLETTLKNIRFKNVSSKRVFLNEFQNANARSLSLSLHISLDDSHGQTFHGELFGLVLSYQGSTAAKRDKSPPLPTTVRARPANGTCTFSHHLLQRMVRWASAAMRSRSSSGTRPMASHMAIRSASACMTLLFPFS
jgi:hypothetical protein